MKSSFLLTEQLIVIVIFAVCAAVCIRFFAASYAMSNSAADLNNAVIIARNGAECYKAAAGNAEKAADILGGGKMADDGSVSLYYDIKRQVSNESEAAYIMYISEQYSDGAPALLAYARVSVIKNGGGELISFTAAARRKS